jgi:hypothetical protein
MYINEMVYNIAWLACVYNLCMFTIHDDGQEYEILGKKEKK